MFNETVTKFSQSLETLGALLGNPLTVEVGGEVTMNVNLNGAEFLKGAQDSMGRFVSEKITRGINDFIVRGLGQGELQQDDWGEGSNEPIAKNMALGAGGLGGMQGGPGTIA